MSKITREVNLVDVPCEIEYAYYKGCKGARDGRYGPPLEPDEPPQVEIDAVVFMGRDLTEYLTDEDREKIEIEILEGIENDCG
jgi:hypothetical protein